MNLTVISFSFFRSTEDIDATMDRNQGIVSLRIVSLIVAFQIFILASPNEIIMLLIANDVSAFVVLGKYL